MLKLIKAGDVQDISGNNISTDLDKTDKSGFLPG